MLSRFAKFTLVATSVAPVLVTWAFADYRSTGPRWRQVSALVTAVGMLAICWLVLTAARRMLPHITMSVSSIRSADTEVVGFMVAYLLPLVTMGTSDFDFAVLGFVVLLISAVVWSTNAYSVNPLLSAIGYHFYEVENADGVTFLMLADRDLIKRSDITGVQQLTRYVLMDLGEGDG